jgi:hypothetical protein
MQRQPSSRDTATQDVATEPRHVLSTTVATHTRTHTHTHTHTTVTDGLSGQPITIRQCLQRHASTSPRAEQHHLSREPTHRHLACYHRCLQYIQTFRQPRLQPSSRCRRSGAPLTHPTRCEGFARRPSCSVESMARTSGASVS